MMDILTLQKLQKLDPQPAMVITPPVIGLDCSTHMVTVSSGGVVLANCSMTSEPIIFEASDGFRVEIKITPGNPQQTLLPEPEPWRLN